MKKPKQWSRSSAFLPLALLLGGCVGPAIPPPSTTTSQSQADASQLAWVEKSDTAGVDEWEELRVTLYWNPQTRSMVRRVGGRLVETDAEFQAALRKAMAIHEVSGNRAELVVVIDPTPEVPWSDVKNVMAACRTAGMTSIGVTCGGRPTEEVLTEIFDVGAK